MKEKNQSHFNMTDTYHKTQPQHDTHVHEYYMYTHNAQHMYKVHVHVHTTSTHASKYLVPHLSSSRRMETILCISVPMDCQTSDQSEAGDICKRS